MRAPTELNLLLVSDLYDLEAVGLELFERFIEIHDLRNYTWNADGTGSVLLVYQVCDKMYEVLYDIAAETIVTEIRERVL